MSTHKGNLPIIPVILAGGVGSRLWPMSREYFPKQCINLIDPNKSLIQQTASRVIAAGVDMAPIVVCNEEHRFLIAQQMSDADISADIILEPMGRNTAPATALAAFRALEINPEAILFVLPADHVIDDELAFSDVAQQAFLLANSENIVTFGIRPKYAETGYGYIQAEQHGCVSKVLQFKEKPDEKVAEAYIKDGRYYWNSGMFVVKAKVYLDELEERQPKIFQSVKKAFKGHRIDLDFIRVDESAFSDSPADSIDYAIMEGTERGVVVPYEGDWSDIGAWSALYSLSDKDKQGNVQKGDVIALDSKNNYIRSESRLVAAVGVEDLAIIETKDAVAVVSLDHAQDVKTIVEQLKSERRTEHEAHTTIYRPWGCYESIDVGDRYQVKNINVNPGEKLSLQLHHHRSEHWIVVSGTAKVRIGESTKLMSENESIYIPVGTVHELSNPGKIPLQLIEVQTGPYLGEDDIVRLDDRYGRI